MCQENLLNFDTVDICKRWGFLNVYLDPNTWIVKVEAVLSLKLSYLSATLHEFIRKTL